MIRVKQKKSKRKKLEVELVEKVAHISELEQELERAKSSDIQKVEQQLALEVKIPLYHLN